MKKNTHRKGYEKAGDVHHFQDGKRKDMQPDSASVGLSIYTCSASEKYQD